MQRRTLRRQPCRVRNRRPSVSGFVLLRLFHRSAQAQLRSALRANAACQTSAKRSANGLRPSVAAFDGDFVELGKEVLDLQAFARFAGEVQLRVALVHHE